MIPKDRDAEASERRSVLDPERSRTPKGPHLRVMATRSLACLLCASPNGSLNTPVTRNPSLPSARSVFGTRRDVTDRRCRLPLSVLGASLSTCCSRFGARRAYSTPRPLSRATGDRRFCSASAAPSSLPGCPGRSGRVGASLKEPHKVTTESLLCQVEGGGAESPLVLPHLTRCQRQDHK